MEIKRACNFSIYSTSHPLYNITFMYRQGMVYGKAILDDTIKATKMYMSEEHVGVLEIRLQG